MIKWLVTWIVVNAVMVPCQDFQTSRYDEYGRLNQTQIHTLQICYDTEPRGMERYFDTRMDAEAFVKKAKESKSKWSSSDLYGFKIKKVPLNEKTNP